MYLKSLKVTNYRNYESLDLDFDRTLNLIVGDNSQGKTNLLESIYYLSSGQSHRNAKQEELIKLDTDFAVIRALITGNDEAEEDRIEKNNGENTTEHLLELELGRTNNIKIRIDRVSYKKKSDFISLLPSVIFSPDDLRIIKGSPSDKREFLDSILEKTHRDYQPLCLKYQKILNQRNGLLKSIANENRNTKNPTLETWNESLLGCGSEIIFKRLELLAEIQGSFSGLLGRFFKGIKAEIFYIFSWERKPYDNFSENSDGDTALDFKDHEFQDLKNIRQEFNVRLEENYHKELNSKTTITGPHRDSFIVLLNGRDIRSFGSQGQQRIASVCLRLCELEILEKKLKKKPVLLLDDVLSELDRQREKLLLEIIGKKFQTFITAANSDVVNFINTGSLNKFIIKDSKVLNG